MNSWLDFAQTIVMTITCISRILSLHRRIKCELIFKAAKFGVKLAELAWSNLNLHPCQLTLIVYVWSYDPVDLIIDF
jgi:hypothetical protein